MKPESNMETDRLLRRFARDSRNVSVPSAGRDNSLAGKTGHGNGGVTEHLDADELIAYAENALPVATRARYTSHLTECDSCRKLISDLVISSGTALHLNADGKASDLARQNSWRDWLAAMFAPRVLRYAASILLIVGISATAFMVFRGGRDMAFRTSPSIGENGSTNEKPTGSAPAVSQPDARQKSNDNAPAREGAEATKSDKDVGAPTETPANAPQDGAVDSQKTGQEQRSDMPASPATAGALSSERNAGRDEEAETRRQPSKSEDALDKNKTSKEVDRVESTGRAARESASSVETENRTNNEGAKIAESKAPLIGNVSSQAKKSARNREPSPAPSSVAQSSATDDRKDQGSGAGKGEESRSVSGRQFVRRNGAWVDVAYRSQATTVVNRGSDQYRALVADEPGLRSVANQLGGVVIVVWNGRAYRIQ